jgi:hypothetical protein
MELFANGLVTAKEQVILALLMQIERGAPDVRAIHDVLNRDGGIPAFVDQVHHGLLKQAMRALYAPICLSFRVSHKKKSYYLSACRDSRHRGRVSEQLPRTVQKRTNTAF